METKKIAVTGLVRKRANEGKPVFAVLASGGIQHVGFTSAGYKEFTVPAEAVAVAYPLWTGHDGYICVHEPCDDLPERGVVSTWRHKGNFKEALAELLQLPVQSEAVSELVKRVARFVR